LKNRNVTAVTKRTMLLAAGYWLLAKDARPSLPAVASFSHWFLALGA
jgi:hypothetical protein